MLGLSLGLGIGMQGSVAPTPSSILGAACIEWWDFRAGGTGAAIASHPGKKSVAALTQASGELQPIWNAAGYCIFDGDNDYLEFTLPTSVASGQIWYETPYGWYKTIVSSIGAHTLNRLNGAPLQQAILVDASVITAAQIAQLTTYMAGAQHGAILYTPDGTIYNRVDNISNVDFTIEYVGSNGATYSKASSQAGDTVDVVAQGLTAPFVMMLPLAPIADVTTQIFNVSQNSLSGAVPGFILPGLTTMYMNNNRLSGATPNIGEASLSSCYLQVNKFSRVTFSALTPTLGTMRLENNMLSSDEVNRVLGAVVAAGRAAGSINISGTNAAPTGQGLIDKAALIARGWSVTTS